MADHGAVAEAVGTLGLVDHHVHQALGCHVPPAAFEQQITESDRPPPPGTTQFDSQLGFAIRRWCAPVLGLPPSAPAGDYLARRAELGPEQATGLLLRATGVACFLIDTGYVLGTMLSLPEMAAASGAETAEIVRLEQVAEQVITAGDGTAAGFAGRYRDALWDRTRNALGLKSIMAYRHGLDFDPGPPAPAAVAEAAGRWLREIEAGGAVARGSGPPEAVRVTDPVLLRHVLWVGVDRRLPVQFHTGFGDPDCDLRRSDPLWLRGFLELCEPRGVPIMLLHCYPFHRNAAALAQAYPHVYLDVGMTLHYIGARAAAVVAESLELAPFAKVLFSSDAAGPAELHYLGALLWRRATADVLGGWVESGDWSAGDAIRVARMIGAENARRVYRLPEPGEAAGNPG
jgi:predicted TIM-barrel fold metal-dependent hydrolase